jgi:hypothetical protein
MVPRVLAGSHGCLSFLRGRRSLDLRLLEDSVVDWIEKDSGSVRTRGN